MTSEIVHKTEIVTLMGPVEVSAEAFQISLEFSGALMAVDGGADQALALGKRPDAVLGDFDSISDKARADLAAARFIETEDQNRTDFDKALSHIAAPLILALGFTGGRLDHELAAYNALVLNCERPVVMVGDVDLCFHINGSIELDLDIGTRVSLFPMADLGCASVGLKWPTDHLTFAPWGRVGTSNAAADSRVTLSPTGAGMLAILPRATLPAVVRALMPPSRVRAE